MAGSLIAQSSAARVAGLVLVALISLIGVRFLFYFHSFFFHWPKYRHLSPVSTERLRQLPSLPFVKVQITTRGSAGSTPVIRRGIEQVVTLVREDPVLYGHVLSIEVITESVEQQRLLEREFASAPLRIQVLALPRDYQTPGGTQLKARALHYMVEQRRRGFNRQPGKTFIVHFDEESVMEPAELRQLLYYLSTTTKRIMEGPIYYPLEYEDASLLCRAMEANRPIGCFECRQVMERGLPLHLHGSNLVVDEALENELGWDIGTLDGQPFIAEDYVFGVMAYIHYGPSIFGWHGCVVLEQPPFSFQSAFKQRFRWIVGVLQGLQMVCRMPAFISLPIPVRSQLLWGTRYRILTFALGAPAGGLSLLYVLYRAVALFAVHSVQKLPVFLQWWLLCLGFLWLNSLIIGAWYNLSSARQLSRSQRWLELAAVLMIAPIAGILEGSAGLWAVVQWMLGNRKVSWQPTPKTKQAEHTLHRRAGGCPALSIKPYRRLALLLGTLVLLVGLASWVPNFVGIKLPGTAGLEPGTSSCQLHLQTGVVFPRWGVSAYSASDPYWSAGLREIQQQTKASWIEVPVNLYQASLSSTQVIRGPQTPSPAAVAAGIRQAHSMGYHVFVVPLITVGSADGNPGGSPGPNPAAWAGSIHFATLQQTAAWFNSYWQALDPYVVAAALSGAEQMAVGTEFELLEPAPASLWEQLIQRVHEDFPGRLTYDRNWSSLVYGIPAWMHDPLLNAIGISAYFPLTEKPQRLALTAIAALWKVTVRTKIDAFARQLGKPVLLSEIGYRNSTDSLYRPWVAKTPAPPDPQEQAAAYNAALQNSMDDPSIEGIYFWAWSYPVYQPNHLPAAQILLRWYGGCQEKSTMLPAILHEYRPGALVGKQLAQQHVWLAAIDDMHPRNGCESFQAGMHLRNHPAAHHAISHQSPGLRLSQFRDQRSILAVDANDITQKYEFVGLKCTRQPRRYQVGIDIQALTIGTLAERRNHRRVALIQ
jgi:hypothetical protein